MAKNVFRSYEFVNKLTQLVPIKSPIPPPSLEDEKKVEEEYLGPSAEDLRKEAEDFKEQWESEKSALIQEAQMQAQEIIQNAEQTAFDIIKKEKDNAQKIHIDSEKEREALLNQAQKKMEEMEAKTRETLSRLEVEHEKKGYDKGFAEGWEVAKVESERLVERIHVIIQKLIEKRSDIIEGAETQIIGLVLLIAKKVIKVISENQKNVVINNVLQALRKIKTRGDVVVRVNLEDLSLTSEHVKEFLRLVENVKSVTVMEDSTVDMGGCIVETDFGEIDARISSQLNEIEEKIMALMPIKAASREPVEGSRE